jgi:hypothetical protein
MADYPKYPKSPPSSIYDPEPFWKAPKSGKSGPPESQLDKPFEYPKKPDEKKNKSENHETLYDYFAQESSVLVNKMAVAGKFALDVANDPRNAWIGGPAKISQLPAGLAAMAGVIRSAYHGTSLDNAYRILAQGFDFRKFGTGADKVATKGWLGTGMYLADENRQAFARVMARSYHKQPGLLHAEYDTEDIINMKRQMDELRPLFEEGGPVKMKYGPGIKDWNDIKFKVQQGAGINPMPELAQRLNRVANRLGYSGAMYDPAEMVVWDPTKLKFTGVEELKPGKVWPGVSKPQKSNLELGQDLESIGDLAEPSTLEQLKAAFKNILD